MHDEGNVQYGQWTLACRFAQKALAEEQVFTWLKTQNLVHGAAPAALQVYEQFRLRQAHASSRRAIDKARYPKVGEALAEAMVCPPRTSPC